MTRTSERPARRRSVLSGPGSTVFMVVLVALFVSGCSLPSPEDPRAPSSAGTPLPTADGTDNERRDENWNVIHRVDVPDGWALSQVQVGGRSELSVWRRVGDASDSSCGVSVFSTEPFSPEPAGGEAVSVHGLPGLFLGEGAGYESLTGLWWHYRPHGWASMHCSDETDRDLHVAMAERVVFRPTQVQMPFRLTAIPPGYTVGWLGWERTSGPASFQLALAQAGDDEFPFPPQVTMAPAASPSPTGRSAQQITVNERAGFYDSRARTLCFPVSGWQACIEGGPDSSPAEPDGDARLRARLLSVAEVLDFASDPDDPGTWFDGNTAAAAR